MKKLLILILALLLSAIYISHCNAQTYVRDFQNVTASDTVTHELQFVKSFEDLQTVYILVDSANTGTVKFAVDLHGTRYPVRSTSKAYGAGARIPVTIRNGLYNLFYKASASGNKFSMTN